MKMKFSCVFLEHLNNNANEAFNITTGVKNTLKQMAINQVLYARVVMFGQKDWKITK